MGGYNNIDTHSLKRKEMFMKKSSYITAAVLAFVLTACMDGSRNSSGTASEGVAGIASTNSASDYTYKNEDGGVEITGSTIKAENIVIPSEIDGKKVVKISGNKSAPLFPNAKTVTLPETLEEIGSYAFANCEALTEITVPASVKEIDDNAFMNCILLSKITLQNGLKEIDEGAFSGCVSLKKIALPDTVGELGYNAFDEKVDFSVTYHGSTYTPANISDLYRQLQ